MLQGQGGGLSAHPLVSSGSNGDDGTIRDGLSNVLVGTGHFDHAVATGADGCVCVCLFDARQRVHRSCHVI